MENLLIIGEPSFIEKSIGHMIASKVSSSEKIYYISRSEGGNYQEIFSRISNRLFNKLKKLIPLNSKPSYFEEDFYLTPYTYDINDALDEIIFSNKVNNITIVITNIDTLVISILEKSIEILEKKNIRIIGTIDKSIAQFTVFEKSNTFFTKVTRIFSKEEIDVLRKL